MRVQDGLDAGTCFINTYNKTDVASPFGGFKQSGFGKDLGTVACKSLETPTFFQFLTHNFSQTFSSNLKFLPNVLYIITIQNPFHKIFKTHRSINFYCFFEKASVQKFRNS